MVPLNRNLVDRLVRAVAVVLLLSLHLFGTQQAVVSAQTRPTLDPSRQPLTALPIATVRAELTATAAVPTAAPATATVVPPTATTAPSSTPPLPNLGNGKNSPDYGLLLGAVLLFWLIGFSVLRYATRRR